MNQVDKGIVQFKKIIEDIDNAGNVEYNYNLIETFFRRCRNLIEIVFTEKALTRRTNQLTKLDNRAFYSTNYTATLKELKEFIVEIVNELETFHAPPPPKLIKKVVSINYMLDRGKELKGLEIKDVDEKILKWNILKDKISQFKDVDSDIVKVLFLETETLLMRTYEFKDWPTLCSELSNLAHEVKQDDTSRQLDALVEFIATIIQDIPKREEKTKLLQDLQKSLAPTPPLKQDITHMWIEEELNIATDVILSYMEYKVQISITDLLSNELYSYVDFLPKNKKGKVTAWEVIDYMREAGLIEKDNKDTEHLTKFGLEVKRYGGWLAYLKKRLNGLEQKKEAEGQMIAETFGTGWHKVGDALKVVSTEKPLAQVNAVSVEVPAVQKPAEQKEPWYKTLGKKIVESAIVKAVITLGGAAWAMIEWDAILNFLRNLWSF